MTFEEYQLLSGEEKMIARIHSLENVARASHFTLASNSTEISQEELVPSKLIKGTITSTFSRSSVSVKVGAGQAKGRALAMKIRRARKANAIAKFYGKRATYVEDDTDNDVKLRVGDTVFISGTPSKIN